MNPLLIAGGLALLGWLMEGEKKDGETRYNPYKKPKKENDTPPPEPPKTDSKKESVVSEKPLDKPSVTNDTIRVTDEIPAEGEIDKVDNPQNPEKGEEENEV